jgi:hypothetical protein
MPVKSVPLFLDITHIGFRTEIKESTWWDNYTRFEWDYPWTIDVRKQKSGAMQYILYSGIFLQIS